MTGGRTSLKKKFIDLGRLRQNKEMHLSSPFTTKEASKSNTYREVRVFWKFYTLCDLNTYKNASILHYKDCQAAEHIITFGSKNKDIQDMVFDMIMHARIFGIILVAK